MEGTYELRRLAMKAFISMGEPCAEVAAYPTCRILMKMQPCCRPGFHPLAPLKKRPPKLCDRCMAAGPFAAGTDFTCSKGCKWDICKDCYCRLRHADVELQRLAAEALFSMGPKAVQTCQVYLARALG